MDKQHRKIEEGPKAKIHIDSLRKRKKNKKTNWKTPGDDGILVKTITFIHDRQAIKMNRCLQEANLPEWMTKRKTTLIQKDPLKETTLKKLQTHNGTAYNVENTNGTNKRVDLQLANKLRIVTWGTERMPQRIQKRKRAILRWSTYPYREQDETEKSTNGVDWLQNGTWYSAAKLDNKLSQNVQNIRWSHELYR